MEEYPLPLDEEYDRQCGDIFLTITGDLVIHCTLCEKRFKGFKIYSTHVIDEHWAESQAVIFDEFEEVSINVDTTIDLTNNSYACEEFYSNDNGYKEAHNKETEETLEPKSTGEVKPSDVNKLKKQKRSAPKRKVSKSSTKFKKLKNILGKGIKCPQCGYSSSNIIDFRAHVRGHAELNTHQCSKCAKAFYTRSELQVHSCDPKGKDKFKCSFCIREYDTSDELAEHVKKHRKYKPKKCTQCPMEFLNDEALNRHICEKFSCNTCGEKYQSQRALNRHMGVHKKYDQFQCHICPSNFKRKGHLNEHLKIHKMKKAKKALASKNNGTTK